MGRIADQMIGETSLLEKYKIIYDDRVKKYISVFYILFVYHSDGSTNSQSVEW